jgi:hypothetical protein
VSYWEWFKLIALALLVSTAITATNVAIWWFMK